jgi:iron(III) transport system substrate-binding protein
MWACAGLGVLALATLALAGCRPAPPPPEVVVYAALDKEFSDPILADFERQAGVGVRAKFDVESTKTVGLTQLLLAEARRPRCDVFWNNEILNTLRLAERGLLDAYIPPAAAKFPAEFRSDQGLWHGFAARARVLIVNIELVPEADRPRSIRDLADPRWHGRCAIAKPLFGTTATHAACLFAHWGDGPAQEFFRSLSANEVQIAAGNKQVALSVATGAAAFGLTDTDDAIIELEAGRPVAIVYPDQEPPSEGGEPLGTLFIPNTLAIIKGGPHPAEARKLVNYLLTAAVEERLAAGPSAQIPLHAEAAGTVRVETPRTVRAMAVDFSAAAGRWDAAAAFLREEFTGE